MARDGGPRRRAAVLAGAPRTRWPALVSRDTLKPATSRRRDLDLVRAARQLLHVQRYGRWRPERYRGTLSAPASVLVASMMPEEREQNDDRQGYAYEPKQSAASETHLSLLMSGIG